MKWETRLQERTSLWILNLPRIVIEVLETEKEREKEGGSSERRRKGEVWVKIFKGYWVTQRYNQLL